jgi:predicted O-linked N-acetylglucosamine transferase (SPINDLY family)
VGPKRILPRTARSRKEEEYEAGAIELALDRSKLKDIKSRLDKNRLTPPLFDTVLYAQHLEQDTGNLGRAST